MNEAPPKRWICAGGREGVPPHTEVENYTDTCWICSLPQPNAPVSLQRGRLQPLPLLLVLAALAAVGGGVWWVQTTNQKPSSPQQAAFTSAARPSSGGNTQPPEQSDGTFTRFIDVTNVPRGIFNYGGSTTFAPLRTGRLVQAIEQAHPGFRLRYTDPLGQKPGSGTGIEMLLLGELSFAQSSRPLKEAEIAAAERRGIDLEQVPVAIDGIAVYVNPANSISGLSLVQLEQIYTGRATNWRQVGGPNLPIVPFSRDLRAGGTVDFMNEHVFNRKGLGRSVRLVQDTTDSLRKVSAIPGGIGYATAAEVVGQRGIPPLPLIKNNTRIAPFDRSGRINESAFTSGSYPITRRLYVIVKHDGRLDEQAGTAYTNLLLSDEGQQWVQKQGFIPIQGSSSQQ